MQAKFNLWLEEDGKVVLSPWRVKLLETIEQTGSISAAAVQLNVPYRRAWEKIQEMEAGLGVALLNTAIGGAGGGGARLTAAARTLLAQFHVFAAGMEQEIEQRYQTVFHAQDQAT